MIGETTIEMIVGRDGATEISVNGSKGKACVALTKELEAGLGAELGDRSLKPEFYVSGEGSHVEQQQGE